MTRRHRYWNGAAAILAIISLGATCVGENQLFVDASATPNGTGADWPNAMRTLSDAIAEAFGSAGRDTIFIAGGIYLPDDTDAPTPPTGDRGQAFDISTTIEIRGGYRGIDGSGGNPSDRNVDLYVTVLSGDLDGDDSSSPLTRDDNSYHVVRSDGLSTLDDARVNGVTISGGNAVDDTGQQYGTWGGGVRSPDSALSIIRSTITDNQAEYGGGLALGDQLETETGGTASIRVVTSRVTFNRATKSGGGVASTGVASTVSMMNTLLHGNVTDSTSSLDGGGAAYAEKGCAIELLNCTIADNASAGRGGGVLVMPYGLAVAGRWINTVVWANEAGDPSLPGLGENIAWESAVGAMQFVLAHSCFIPGIDVEGFGQYQSDENIGDPDPGLSVVTFRPYTYSGLIAQGLNPGEDNQILTEEEFDDTFDINDNGNTTELAPDMNIRTRIVGEIGDPDPVIDIGAYELSCDPAVDVNGDGFVGFADLILVLDNWGACPGCPSDIDGNGTTGFSDLIIILDKWGCGDDPATAAPASVMDCLSKYSDPGQQAKCIQAMMLAGTP